MSWGIARLLKSDEVDGDDELELMVLMELKQGREVEGGGAVVEEDDDDDGGRHGVEGG